MVTQDLAIGHKSRDSAIGGCARAQLYEVRVTAPTDSLWVVQVLVGHWCQLVRTVCTKYLPTVAAEIRMTCQLEL